MTPRPPPDLPRATGDLDELRAVQVQLAGMRQRLKDLRYPDGEVSEVGPAVAGGLLGLALVVGIVALAARDVAGSRVLAGCAAGVAVLVVVAVVVLRRTRSDTRRKRTLRHRRRLLSRNAELWAALRPEPADDLPLPPDRQPLLYAPAWHARYGHGPEPEVALRQLPPDAGRPQVLFHRWGGRNGVEVAVRVLVALVVGVVALVLRVRG